jgi:hypothetical protein
VADDWHGAARDYRQRTGDEMRDIYLALLSFIGARHPRVMAEARRTLERTYPHGLKHDANCRDAGGCGPGCPWSPWPSAAGAPGGVQGDDLGPVHHPSVTV